MVGAALFLLSPMAEAEVSGAVCNTNHGGGSFRTAVIVWVDGVRNVVKLGERGLTAEIAYSDEALLGWMRSEFAGGSPEVNVGFNDCAGSQLQPQQSPVSAGQGGGSTPPPTNTTPATQTPPQGNAPDTPPAQPNPPSAPPAPPSPNFQPPMPPPRPPTQNDYISVSGGHDDGMIVGDGTDVLFG